MQKTHHAIGILGGTFDPIHLGHLRMGLELYAALNLNKVHIVPCYQPVHRKMPEATPEQRLEMVQAAVMGENAFFADDREIRRGGPSYMIDTLAAFRKEMPDTSLCLLVGIDAFLNLPSWGRWMDIFEYAHVIVAHRPQYHLPETGLIADLIKARIQHKTNYIHENLAGGIFLLPITALEISASDIRKQIAMERNPRYLLPDEVYRYIKQHSTYSIIKR